MLPSRLWKKEFQEDFRNKKNILIKLALPIIIVAPLSLESVPPFVKAMGFTLIVIFIGIFGSSIGLVKLKESNMLERLALLPTKPYLLIFDYLFANCVVDSLQLAIPLLIVSMSINFSVTKLSWLFICFLISILAANIIGFYVSILSGSSGEVHLYSTISVFAVALISGLFIVKAPEGLDVYSLSPFNQLFDGFLYTWGISNLNFPILLFLPIFVLLLLTAIISKRIFYFD